jgi:hypothetical protein
MIQFSCSESSTQCFLGPITSCSLNSYAVCRGHAQEQSASNNVAVFTSGPEVLNLPCMCILSLSGGPLLLQFTLSIYAVFQVVTIQYRQSMCGRSYELLLVPGHSSSQVVVGVGVVAVRVKECGNSSNSCSWGNKYLQLISTPLAAWPSRFLPLVSDNIWICVCVCVCVGGGGLWVVLSVSIWLKCLFMMPGEWLAVESEQFFDITEYYVVQFLDHHWSTYVLSHTLGVFYFRLCPEACILLFNILFNLQSVSVVSLCTL